MNLYLMMKPTRLVHPLFLFSIFILLINDFYLKAVFHNALTGKLSDISGLFAFGVFLISIFPFHKKTILVIAALFFCWWKSALSTGTILYLNESLNLDFHRAEDYSDLFCLPMLPLSLLLKPVMVKTYRLQTATVWSVSAIAFFSFCATSQYRRLYYSPYRENEIYFDLVFKTSLSPGQVLEKLCRPHGQYKVDSVRYFSVLKNEQLVYQIRNGNDTAERWVPASNNKDSSLFIKKLVAPFYIIPYICIGEDTLFNTEVNISREPYRKKSTYVQVYSFRLSPRQGSIYERAAEKHKYFKQYFKRLLKEK